MIKTNETPSISNADADEQAYKEWATKYRDMKTRERAIFLETRTLYNEAKDGWVMRVWNEAPNEVGNTSEEADAIINSMLSAFPTELQTFARDMFLQMAVKVGKDIPGDN
jgi:hypothetical protein